MNLLLRSFVIVAAIAAVSSCSPVQADVIVGNDAVFGDGSITIDRETGLEWLDWDLSTNLSFNEVSSQFGDGGDFAGFRHATLQEVEEFLVNITGLAPFPDTDQLIFDEGESARTVIDFVGATNTTAPASDPLVSQVVTQQPSSTIGENVGRGVVSAPNFGGGVSQYTVFSRTRGSSSAGIGNALVRVTADQSSVPEPTSLICLMGLGIVGLTGRRRVQ